MSDTEEKTPVSVQEDGEGQDEQQESTAPEPVQQENDEDDEDFGEEVMNKDGSEEEGNDEEEVGEYNEEGDAGQGNDSLEQSHDEEGSGDATESVKAAMEKYQHLKTELLETINKSRAENDLPPLEYDEQAAQAADEHCAHMCENGFLGYCDLGGRKPYLRYFSRGVEAHVTELVGGRSADNGDLALDVSAVRQLVDDVHLDFLSESPPGKDHGVNPQHTHIGIGLYINKQHFRLVEVYVDRHVTLLRESPSGETAPSFDLTSDETFVLAKCTTPGYDIVAAVVYYEPEPRPLSVQEADKVRTYKDHTKERVAVVWPWEMERADDGSLRIPFFFTVLKAGIYYTQLLVRGEVQSIPYTAPSEDLDIEGPDVIPATGLILTASKEAEAIAAGLGALPSQELGVGGSLDLIGTGAEPFSEITITEGSEPPPLGFKRQNVLLRMNLPHVTASQRLKAGEGEDAEEGGEGSTIPDVPLSEPSPFVLCLANAPGLPPVVAATLVSATMPSQATPPEGFEIIGGNLVELLARSKGLADVVGSMNAPSAEDAAEGEEGLKSVGVTIAGVPFDPPCVFLAVKRQTEEEAAVALAKGFGDGRGADNLLLDAALGFEVTEVSETKARLDGARIGLPKAPTAIPEGYESKNIEVKFGGVGKYEELLRGKLLLTYTKKAEAVGKAVASQATGYSQLEQLSSGLDVPLTPPKWEKEGVLHDANLDASQSRLDMPSDLQEPSFGYEPGLGQEHSIMSSEAPSLMGEDGIDEEDEALAAARRREEHDRLVALLEETRQESEELTTANARLQQHLAFYFHKREEEEKAAEKSLGAVKPAAAAPKPGESEKRYNEILAQVVREREALQAARIKFEDTAVELQARLDEKEQKASTVYQDFVDFKRDMAMSAVNSRTGRHIPRRIIAQFEMTEKAKDQEVEKVRLRNIHLRMQLRKLEARLKDKEQLADGLHLIDFEQLKIENQTLNEKIEDRNEELQKLRKKTTQTVQVLTHIKEKLQFVRAENEVLQSKLEEIEAQVAQQRDMLSRSKRTRDKLRTDIERCKQKQGFVNTPSLVVDFEKRKKEIRDTSARIEELKARYRFLTGKLKQTTGSAPTSKALYSQTQAAVEAASALQG